jgi:hypothetical protein
MQSEGGGNNRTDG